MKIHNLKNGIKLFVENNDKFNSSYFSVEFDTLLTKKNAAARSLLAQILSNSSKKYPNRQKITSFLDNDYGAEFFVTTTNLGRMSRLIFILKFPDPSLFPEDDLVKKTIDFLYQQIFYPLINSDGSFDPKVFSREKENFVLLNQSNLNDKNYLLHDQVRHHFFTDQIMKMPLQGESESILSLTNQDLAEEYKNIFNNSVLVGFSGKTDVSALAAEFEKWPIMSKRAIDPSDFLYVQKESKTIDSFFINKQGDQSLLEIAYLLKDFDLRTNDYFLSLLFSKLFGGYSRSLLFLSVREEQHLAYSIDSFLYPSRSLLVVSSGLKRSSIDSAEKIIDQQHKKISHGDLSAAQFVSAKKELISDIRFEADSQQARLQRNRTSLLEKDYLTDHEIIKSIERIDLRQLALFSQRVIKQVSGRLINEN
ncbi:M16 family metallopeptidase [Oenococcus alcoholitolerans]|uniref:Peptidase M16 C-terminal domain-containing protein n=1 Tax=Oenococcus alcoholitolerans TaxID=931074 RepID=A0ABR4XRZ0_9LACO|nr:hypothetical protein Q757_03055 [Oenococcus alcoholitolerans]